MHSFHEPRSFYDTSKPSPSLSSALPSFYLDTLLSSPLLVQPCFEDLARGARIGNQSGVDYRLIVKTIDRDRKLEFFPSLLLSIVQIEVSSWKHRLTLRLFFQFLIFPRNEGNKVFRSLKFISLLGHASSPSLAIIIRIAANYFRHARALESQESLDAKSPVDASRRSRERGGDNRPDALSARVPSRCNGVKDPRRTLRVQ